MNTSKGGLVEDIPAVIGVLLIVAGAFLKNTPSVSLGIGIVAAWIITPFDMVELPWGIEEDLPAVIGIILIVLGFLTGYTPANWAGLGVITGWVLTPTSS